MRTVPIDPPDDLLALLPRQSACAWLRGRDGLVGWGEAARFTGAGGTRLRDAGQWWDQIVSGLDVTDGVEVPGSGPVAFASFTFDAGPTASVMVMPSVVIGRRDGAAWLTVVDDAPPKPALDPVTPLGAISLAEGRVTSDRYRAIVAEAVRRIRNDELQKVVLAREVVASVTDPVDVRALLRPLNNSYASCWTFSVDRLVGATPELLVRRTGDHVVSRVLAGTIARGSDPLADAQHAATLVHSSKDRSEHDLAVQSVAQALAPLCADLVVPRTPEIVRLANVHHLQTDVTGRLSNGETALDVAAALHPTAAVCGTPTSAARQLIADLEQFDRGRYAGPVGWVDGRGDGSFGIALRCAQVSEASISMIAGAGIVRDSVPEDELVETEQKLRAMLTALHS